MKSARSWKPCADGEAWLAWYAEEDLPARATIGVADLGDARRLVEITASAAVKEA
ncbi:enamine deaminase RidA (YjgF/YER057c/UK114 family) [Rhizobium sp. BK399]|nr:enamine deaminase RidA (YjgF/YER057c/UK114 family) [Rhizobium sp. BK399]